MSLMAKLFKHKKSDPEIVIESTSPKFNLNAFVEQDDRVAYFYLTEVNKPGIKSCWIKNLCTDNTADILSQMRKGLAPTIPDNLIRDNKNTKPLNKEELEIIWFQECDGVALLENNKVIAIIPVWSGQHGFHGYSSNCKIECEVCWPLTEDNVLIERTFNAKDFWSIVYDQTTWESIQNYFLTNYEKSIGKYDHYYQIDNNQWPAKALIDINNKDARILITLGVSTLPQPTVELSTDNPEIYRRIEICFCGSNSLSQNFYKKMAKYISGQSNLPWTNHNWLGNGHTIACDILQEEFGNEFNYIVLLKDFSPFKVDVEQFGDRVNILFIYPISDTEKDFIINNGSSQFVEILNKKYSTTIVNKRGIII